MQKLFSQISTLAGVYKNLSCQWSKTPFTCGWKTQTDRKSYVFKNTSVAVDVALAFRRKCGRLPFCPSWAFPDCRTHNSLSSPSLYLKTACGTASLPPTVVFSTNSPVHISLFSLYFSFIVNKPIKLHISCAYIKAAMMPVATLSPPALLLLTLFSLAVPLQLKKIYYLCHSPLFHSLSLYYSVHHIQ